MVRKTVRYASFCGGQCHFYALAGFRVLAWCGASRDGAPVPGEGASPKADKKIGNINFMIMRMVLYYISCQHFILYSDWKSPFMID